MFTMLDDLPRIVRAAKNGDHLTKIEALALADAYEAAKARQEVLESALDVAQTMIEARPLLPGCTAFLAAAATAVYLIYRAVRAYL